MNIAVIIPCFNAAAFVIRALDSVLLQTLPVAEIVIVNDGSSDDTISVVQRWCTANPRVNLKVVEQQNAGVAAARNSGVKATDCQWVCFLDADDEWLPHHNEVLNDLFTDNSDVKFLFADGEKVREDKLIGDFFASRGIKQQHFTHEQLNYEMIRGSFIPMCSTGFERETFLHEGGFNVTFHYGEDRELIMRFLAHYAYNYSLNGISRVHYHNANATSAKNKMKMEAGLVNLNDYIKLNSHLYRLDKVCLEQLNRQIVAKLLSLSYITSELGLSSYLSSKFFPRYFASKDFVRSIYMSFKNRKI